MKSILKLFISYNNTLLFRSTGKLVIIIIYLFILIVNRFKLYLFCTKFSSDHNKKS